MAKDLSIHDLQVLRQYGGALRRSAANLEESYRSIRRHAETISQSWDDKQNQRIMELIHEKERVIKHISEIVNNYGISTQKYVDKVSCANSNFMRNL